MKTCKVRHFILTVATCLSLAGCATFRAGKLEAIKQWPLAAGSGETIAYTISSEAYRNGKLLPESTAGTNFVARHIELMFRQSGLFTAVWRGHEHADRFAEMRSTHRLEESMGMAVLSGLTLTLVPVISRMDITLTTTFKDADGNVLGTIVKTESVSTWLQAFMIFLTPVKFPTRVIAWTINDLVRTTLQDASANGWL